MPDYTVEDTLYKRFTTRAFASGVPTTLAGTPVVSAYEDDSVTQITAGMTLGVDHDSVTGLNLLTIVATGANGFEAGKSYDCVITTGTVGGVSVVGEVVWHFTLSAEAAAVDLANGTDGLGAIKTDTAAVLVDTGEIGAAGAGLTNINLPNQTMDIVGNITGNISGSVGSITGHTAQTGDNFARIGAPAGASVSADVAAVKADTAAVLVDTADMQPKIGAPAADVSADIAAVKAETVLIVADTSELQTDWANAGRLDVILDARASQTTVDAIETDTQDIQARVPAALVGGRIDATVDGTGMESGAIDAILQRQITEAYNVDGTAPTVEQALMGIFQSLTEFSIVGTTITVKKLDGSTAAMTFTLDDATDPTSRTRAT